MNKRNRVFFASGPLQSVMSLCIIEDAGNNEAYNNYAFISNTGAAKNANEGVIAATRGVLETGEFERIEDITDIDEEVVALYENDRFEECEALIRSAVGLDNVDELFMIQNTKQIMTIMAGRAYDSSHIVNFGDGMGFITSGLGYGVCHLDEIRTFLPIDYTKGFCEKVPLKIMDKDIFYFVADRYYEKNKAFRNAIDKRRAINPENSSLLMLQQFSEWRMMDFEDEISMYIKAVKRNCREGETIVIKEHPRSTVANRGKLLAELLTESGYSVIRLTEEELRLVPIELICRFLKVKRVVCSTSTCGITLRYFYGMDADISVDEDDYKNYKRGRTYLRMYIEGLRHALENVDTWNRKGPLYTYEKPPLNYHTSTKSIAYITYEEAGFKILNNFYSKKRRLSAFFSEKGMKSVIIYGLSKIGTLMAEDLAGCSELELHIFDRSLSGRTYLDKPVYYFDTFDKKADCVFVATTYSLDEIKGLIKKHMGDVAVFSLADL